MQGTDHENFKVLENIAKTIKHNGEYGRFAKESGDSTKIVIVLLLLLLIITIARKFINKTNKPV